MICLHIRIEILAPYCIVQSHIVQERAALGKMNIVHLLCKKSQAFEGKKPVYSSRSGKEADDWISPTLWRNKQYGLQGS